MKKTITIGDTAVSFKSSAAVPRIYRLKFGRDIFLDMAALADQMEKTGTEDSGKAVSSFPIALLEVFENLAWTMAKHADPEIPEPDEWLERFEVFSIYQILPELLDMWKVENLSIAESKKNLSIVSGI